MLSADVKELGAAIVKGNMRGQDTWISVQIFGLESQAVPQDMCIAPSQELLDKIQVKKTEINNLNDRLKVTKRELDNEHASIEHNRRLLSSGTPQDRQQLSVSIKAYNEKIAWHNERLADVKAKALVLQSMIDEYNEMLQTYKTCKTSH